MSEVLLEPLLRRLRLRRVISQIPANASVLDIGCGQSAALLNAIAHRIDYGIGVDFKVLILRLPESKRETLKQCRSLRLRQFPMFNMDL